MRARAAGAACMHLLAAGLPRRGSRVAVYLPIDGELDPGPIIEAALARRCRVYVPVVERFRTGRMHFAPLAGAALRTNRWGLREPSSAAGGRIDPRWLDLVLVPCVGVDARGYRLGMGKGFYDRRFAFLAQRKAWRRPRLIALAYDFQRLDAVPPAPWDVPAWAILTPRGLFRAA